MEAKLWPEDAVTTAIIGGTWTGDDAPVAYGAAAVSEGYLDGDNSLVSVYDEVNGFDEGAWSISLDGAPTEREMSCYRNRQRLSQSFR